MRTAGYVVVAAFALLFSPLNATTCIAGKSFKVAQVCGRVTDKDDAVIPDAKIKITPMNHLEDAKEVNSDREGRFAVPNLADGEYEIRVKYEGFWDAWQAFSVGGSSANQKCTRPMHVVMKPAGQCSFVENAWPKLKKK